MIEGVPIRTVTVELTHRCHRRCAFCYVPRPADGSGPELPGLELAARVGRLVRDTGCSHVQLSGGEPLLREDLLEIVDALSAAARVRISLLTDGAHLDAALARELARRSVGPVQPTLLAGRAAAHDALRGPGAFADATRSIAVARAAGLPVVVSMVITSRSWADAGAVAELSFALGARSLTLARFCPAGAASAAHRSLTPSHEQVYAAVMAAAPTCRALGLKLSAAITIPACVFPDRERPPLRLGVCSLVGPQTAVTVGPDGAVRTCAMSSVRGGVLGEDPWPEIARRLWDEELGPLREAVPDACRRCPVHARCLGGCRLSALAVHGRPDALDPVAPRTDRL